MDKDTFLSKITEIGTCEDDVARRTLLTELSDGVSQVFDDFATSEQTSKETIETLNQTIEKNKEDITKLQDANMTYFLRLNSQNNEGNNSNSASTGIKEPESNKRKFEDLFKEGGN